MRDRIRTMALTAAGLAGSVEPALAQVDLMRTRPPASSQAGLVIDTPEVGQVGRFQLGLQHETTGVALLLRNPDTGQPVMDGHIIERRHLTQLAAAVALTSRLEIGVAWGGAMQMGSVAQGRPILDRFGLVDFEVRAKYGRPIGNLALALIGRTFAPTGNEAAYLGSSGPSAGLSILVGRRWASLALTASAGYRIRPRQRAFDLVVDDELEFGAAARWLHGRWWIDLEATGLVGVGARWNAAERPIVSLGGGGFSIGEWSVHVGVGAGMSRGYGAPTWEALFAIRRASTRISPSTRIAWEPPDEPEYLPPAVDLVFMNDRLTLPDRVLFALDDDTVRPEAMPLLAEVVERWRDEPTWYRLRVEGHADTRGDAASNLALSQRRADAVRAALIRAGGESSRIDAVGFGERRPLVHDVDESSHARNRRVELVVERKTPEMP